MKQSTRMCLKNRLLCCSDHHHHHSLYCSGKSWQVCKLAFNEWNTPVGVALTMFAETKKSCCCRLQPFLKGLKWSHQNHSGCSKWEKLLLSQNPNLSKRWVHRLPSSIGSPDRHLQGKDQVGRIPHPLRRLRALRHLAHREVDCGPPSLSFLANGPQIKECKGHKDKKTGRE